MRGRAQIPVYDSRTRVIIANSVLRASFDRYTFSPYPWISILVYIYIYSSKTDFSVSFARFLFFFSLWFSLKWKILIGKEKKTDRSMSGLFENFEKIYFWYVSIYAFMNICVETLKRLLLLLFLLRRYTEYVLKALEDRRKPVSEISRVMILASTYNVVVWIYYISWKRRS